MEIKLSVKDAHKMIKHSMDLGWLPEIIAYAESAYLSAPDRRIIINEIPIRKRNKVTNYLYTIKKQ